MSESLFGPALGTLVQNDSSKDDSKKDYLNITFIEPLEPKPLFLPGHAASFINDAILLKRHISGNFSISHRDDFLMPGGYQFDLYKCLDNLRNVMYEELPARKFSIEFPIDKTPFWFKKYGKVDLVTTDDVGNVETSEVDGFTTIEFRQSDTPKSYPLIPLLFIDTLYRLKNLEPEEEAFIAERMFEVARKRKQGWQISNQDFGKSRQTFKNF